MMLSRLVLHPLSRDVAACVQDAQRLHQLVLAGFGLAPAGDPRAHHGILFRLDVDARTGALTLYVQSTTPPEWARLPEGVLAAIDEPNPAVRSLEPVLRELSEGMLLRFRLRANVTRKIRTKSEGGQSANGTRVPLRDDAKRLAWLVRKGAAAGFAVVTQEGQPDVMIVDEGKSAGRRDGQRLVFEGVRFDGRLRVTDPHRFREALRTGIGPAKAYGYGLLSVAPG